MIRSLLLLILLFNFSLESVSQEPEEEMDGKVTMQSGSFYASLFPEFRLDYRILLKRIGFNASVQAYNKTTKTSDMFLYDPDFNDLPTSISDTSINYNFNTWESKSFSIQAGIGTGTDFFMFADEWEHPKFLVRLGAEFSYGRKFSHQLHGDGYYKIGIDSITNQVQYYDSNSEAVNSQDDATRIVSNFELSKYITNEFGALIFVSGEYFILGSRLSIGAKFSGGLNYSWLYQYHGLLDESKIDSEMHKELGSPVYLFGFLAWSF